MVTIFTREQGKVRAVAKGAKRSTSKLVGHLEPLTHLQLSMSHGRSLDYVIQAQGINNFPSLKSNLDAVTKGLYAAELVDGFGSEASPNQSLYDLILETLGAIDRQPDSEWPLRFFEVHLLRVSGLMPELYHCVECRQPLEQGRHRFSQSLGGALCLECHPEGANIRPLSLRALKVLRLIHRGLLAEVLLLKADPQLSDELKSLIGGAVSYWLEREIRSKPFMDQLRGEHQKGVYK